MNKIKKFNEEIGNPSWPHPYKPTPKINDYLYRKW